MKKLPKVTPEDLKVIEESAASIASSTWIPGYDVEDIRQEAIIIGIKGLEKYNGSIPLDKFISNRIRQRLRSLRRDKYVRPGCDCGNCLKCSNNKARMKINGASELHPEENCNSIQYEMDDQVQYKELTDYLDESIPADLREDYLKVLAGITIPSVRKQKLKKFIKDLLDD